MRFPRFLQHSTTALLCGGLMGTTLAKGDQPNIAVQTLIPQVDPTNTNVVTGIGVSYPTASTNHKSNGSIINSKEGYETEVHSLYVTTTAITFVDLVLPESEDDEDDRGSNTEMPTEMPTWTVFFFAAVLDVVIRGAFV
ncbi:hypothetical protein NEUTE1DRAFT_112139 [Neurospora tetrasperma FGSC 2508]|uniref:Uncharacterized protein n=1 Tax=Neurospora tetrasperma (strain FGSC 2508 / ATCC MYA-4615 / P0657) TaxID=510951 RepID=F8MUF0_NEUT8|nr:uncharacterized protein NEUTE1DRAFT_112139 [Neurospora tetrasperma FGSC 2508]EGO55632.1 hypothetical protein NEUTE1DRAFT_112139 [Neurospora tetrasperma FGSC 2508]EGZ69123.1 hypothetical protein NEUTE2DRAFT_140769 [Neurospora tetrasperma FGSC 2509]